jgi:hypothetical protein
MSQSTLISVSYISKATQDMGVLALMRLTDQAAQFNQKLGLSGVLFYENQHFGQILEGPREAVMKLWEKIQQDPRHQQVRLLKMEDIEERNFPAWSMRFFLAKEIIAKMPNLTGILDGLPEHDDELLRLMRAAGNALSK